MIIQASIPLFRALPALALLCAAPVSALFMNEAVAAYRIADGSIGVDGKPDSLWRSLYAMGAYRSFSFRDYSKLVLLQSDKIRNENPAHYVASPPAGSATLMAVYDSKALYFLFMIRTQSIADPGALGCPETDLWKIDAAEVYVDPSPWSVDPLDYHSYFTADAGGLVYGTSPRTIQVDKPISSRESRFFYRDRKTADRFQAPAAQPTGITVATARSASDTAWVAVEMRIPFWTSASDFAPGKSMFLSWGFNHYSDSVRTNCNANPLAYRWAKNFLNYDLEPEKPPGWRAGDSTHYDPVRSWDGWGRLILEAALLQNGCRSSDIRAGFEANWDPDYWRAACNGNPTTASRFGRIRLDGAGMPVPSPSPYRDARGRRLSSSPAGFTVPDFR